MEQVAMHRLDHEWVSEVVVHVNLEKYFFIWTVSHISIFII